MAVGSGDPTVQHTAIQLISGKQYYIRVRGSNSLNYGDFVTCTNVASGLDFVIPMGK